jgi:Caspase domain
MSELSDRAAGSRIVLVGASSYLDPTLLAVPGIVHNVSDLAAVLTAPDLGAFDPSQCSAATVDADLRQVGHLLTQAADQAEHLLLFYYGGHGLLDANGSLYLSLHGTQTDLLRFTALPYELVRDSFRNSGATNKIVIIDSCYSGRAIGKTLAATESEVLGQLDIRGTYTLASCPPNSLSLALDGEVHTAFTERLLTVLHTGLPGAGPMLTLGEIYRAVRAQMQADALLLPQQCTTGTIDQYGLVLNRRSTHPAGPAGRQPVQQAPPVRPPLAASGATTHTAPPTATGHTPTSNTTSPITEWQTTTPTSRISRTPYYTPARALPPAPARWEDTSTGVGVVAVVLTTVLLVVAGWFAVTHWHQSSSQGTPVAGTGWSQQSLPRDFQPSVQGIATGIDSVSCPTPAFCMLVGGGYSYTLTNGAWQSRELITSDLTAASAVSCASASFCVAAGAPIAAPIGQTGSSKPDVATLFTFSGGGWSSVRLPADQDSNFNASVSCVTTEFCAATLGVDAFTYADGRWSAADDLHGNENLGAVSCVSGDWCLTMSANGATYAYSGGKWTGAAVPAFPTDFASGELSCASDAFCAASPQSTVLYTLSGGRWSEHSVADVSDDSVTGISCPGVGSCIAVSGDAASTYANGAWSSRKVLGSDVDIFQYLTCATLSSCLATTWDQELEAYSGPPAST